MFARKLAGTVLWLFIARTAVAVSNFALMPLYVHKLGVETAGVLSLFATLQAFVMVFDLGMTTVGSRFAARLHAKGSTSAQWDVLRLAVMANGVLGFMLAVIMAVLWGLSDTWVHQVIEQQHQSHPVVILLLVSLMLGMAWPQNMLQGVLAGLGRFGSIALSTIATSVLRVAFVAVGLSWQHSILWVVASLFVCTTVHSIWLYAALSQAIKLKPRIIPTMLEIRRSVVRFINRDLILIGLMGVIVTQADKLVVSTMVEPAQYAAYAMAAMASAALFMLINPLHTALVPYFASIKRLENTQDLARRYRQASVLASTMVIPAGLTMIFFAEPLLLLWLRKPELAAQAHVSLSLLAAGTMLNGLLYVPYTLQLSVNWTRLALVMNLVLLCVLVPSMLLLTHFFGVHGAAACWMLVNAVFLVVWPALMHRRLLKGHAVSWYTVHIIKPLIIGILIFALMAQLLQLLKVYQLPDLGVIAFITLAYGVSMLAVLWFDDDGQQFMLNQLMRHKAT
jgi:O-antigen/teichoic acid export membrane protein